MHDRVGARRSSWQVTWAVWHALLLREAVARLFARRGAAVWLVLEPLGHVGYLLLIYTVLRATHIGGMDTRLWLLSGMLAFLLFRRTSAQGSAAVDANLALFAYRQVRPADAVLMRCVLEAFLMGLITAVLMSGLCLLGADMSLHDPWALVVAVLGLWLLATGWGLVMSVATDLAPEAGNVMNMLNMPLMMLSGVMVPMTAIPQPVRGWAMLNPIAHGLEGVRAAMSPFYHHAPELDLGYLMACALVVLFLGLALHVRFRNRLVAL